MQQSMKYPNFCGVNSCADVCVYMQEVPGAYELTFINMSFNLILLQVLA